LRVTYHQRLKYPADQPATPIAPGGQDPALSGSSPVKTNE
jgi:hypothetical protein